MNKDEALSLLNNQVSAIPDLAKSYSRSSTHSKWVMDTMYVLEEIFGQNSRIYLTFASLTWDVHPGEGVFVHDVRRSNEVIEALRHRGFLQDLEIAQGLLQSGIDLVSRKALSSVYEGKDTPKESSEIIKIISLIENKFRKVIREKPTKEKQLQDALESLLIGANLDGEYTREKEEFLYSSKGYIPDFVFARINTIIEIKLCDTEQRLKVIIPEINDDILAYKTKYTNLIFLIYDLGIIRDQDEFKTSLEANENVIVKIIKH